MTFVTLLLGRLGREGSLGMWLPLGSGEPTEEAELELMLDLIEEISQHATGVRRNPLAPTEVLWLMQSRGSWCSASANSPEVAAMLDQLKSVSRKLGRWIIWDSTDPRGVRVVDLDALTAATTDRHGTRQVV